MAASREHLTQFERKVPSSIGFESQHLDHVCPLCASFTLWECLTILSVFGDSGFLRACCLSISTRSFPELRATLRCLCIYPACCTRLRQATAERDSHPPPNLPSADGHEKRSTCLHASVKFILVLSKSNRFLDCTSAILQCFPNSITSLDVERLVITSPATSASLRASSSFGWLCSGNLNTAIGTFFKYLDSAQFTHVVLARLFHVFCQACLLLPGCLHGVDHVTTNAPFPI